MSDKLQRFLPVVEGEVVFELPRGAKRVFESPISCYVLDQDEWWKPRDSAWIPLSDMDLSHQSNLLRFLRKNAAACRSQAQKYEISMFMAFDRMMGENADWGGGWDDDMQGNEPLWDKDVSDSEWLEATPLVQKLSEIVASAYE